MPAHAGSTRSAVLLKSLFFTVSAILLAAVLYAGWIVAETWHRVGV